MAKVFISFNYKDISSTRVVENWKNQGLGEDISISTIDGENYSFMGKEFVENKICEQINKCQVLLALVGDNSHNRPWMDYEIHYANSEKIPVLWTQIPNTTGGVPKELARNKNIEFNMRKIEEAIRNAVNHG